VDGSSPTPQPDVFSLAVGYVIDRLEGGGTIEHDAGGWTRWGIAERYHPGIDVRSLSRNGAEAIYRAEYWTPLRCGDMPPSVGFLAFDCAVNPGTGAAVLFLQSELGVERDGVVGPDTLDAARSAARKELLIGLTARRLDYYRQDVLRHPPQVVNLDGWTRRSLRSLLFAQGLL